VYVYAPNTLRAARFIDVLADGIAGRQATKTLTLQFTGLNSVDFAGLKAADITLIDKDGTGIQKGALTGGWGGLYACGERHNKSGHGHGEGSNTGRVFLCAGYAHGAGGVRSRIAVLPPKTGRRMP
jgi:hypothetical protein